MITVQGKLLRALLLSLAMVGLALFLFREPLLSQIANYLVVADPLRHADTVVVLAGGEVARCPTAAALFAEGWAPRIVVTKGQPADEEKELQRYGIPTLEPHEKCSAILTFHGVPEDAVDVLDGHNESTADEAVKILHYLQTQRFKRVLIVTSNFHTRRTRLVFRRILHGSDIQVSVQPTPPDSSFDPHAWWTRRRDSKFVLWEYQKLLFYALRYW